MTTWGTTLQPREYSKLGGLRFVRRFEKKQVRARRLSRIASGRLFLRPARSRSRTQQFSARWRARPLREDFEIGMGCPCRTVGPSSGGPKSNRRPARSLLHENSNGTHGALCPLENVDAERLQFRRTQLGRSKQRLPDFADGGSIAALAICCFGSVNIMACRRT